jgi:imidazoleglycerol-phosphate dehydratase/histidinol-phosphatase
MASEPQKIIFIDRDGTIIEEPHDEQIDSLEKLRFLPGIVHGLRSLVAEGYGLVMVSNQDALGSTSYPQAAFDTVQSRVIDLLEGEGIRFQDILICPHMASDGCSCRKPQPGLVASFMENNPVDRSGSFVLGDRETDVQFARNLGVTAIRLVPSDDTPTDADVSALSIAEACAHILRRSRTATVTRTTSETDVNVTVSLDGTGEHDVSTGLGFLDHMLSLLLKHASVDASVRVSGDLHVDEHHTIEDTGLVLGEAIRQALGSKNGIERYGFMLPMDEAQAHVAVDLSGRPYLVFSVDFTRDIVGDVPTELFEDFFRAFADGLRANVHISATGRNDHHIAEACFKGMGRSLRQAFYRREDLKDILPSTKGML